MTADATDRTERTVWEGGPSVLADLPTYLALGIGALAATAGLLLLRNAAVARATVGSSNPAGVFTWIIVGLWVVAALLALYVFARARSVKYVLTTERLRITTGLLSTATDDVELWRVRDMSVIRPALLRIVGLGHVVLVSADRTTPRIELRSVHGPDALQTKIRDMVQVLHRRHGVREVDVT